MRIYELDGQNISAEDAAAADIVYFIPRAALLTGFNDGCRDGWRAALLAAARRNVRITASVTRQSYGSLPAGANPDVCRVALCELLSYADFLLTDSYCAAHTIGMTEDEPRELLRAIHTRFGLEAAVLTDLPLAYDGERFTAGLSGT